VHLTINSQILASELRLLNRVAPIKSGVTILSHILVRADEKMTCYATDLEIGLHTTVPAQIHAPGIVTLPAERWLAMVEQFPNADVTITVEGKHAATMRCGAFTSKLQTLPADDFPPPPPIDGTSHLLDATDLRRIIDSTRYAIAEKDGRYYLQGTLLTLTGPMGAMVATDGKQLALATMVREGTDARVILPGKTVEILSLQTDLRDITMTIGTRHLFFAASNRVIISRMVEGEYPNYDRIIPRTNTIKAVVDRFALSAALRRVGLAAGDTHATTFSFSAEGLDLSASSQVGHADERVAINSYEGEPVTLWTNWKFVLNALDVSLAPTVTCMIKDARSPLLLLDGEQHVTVILPIAAG
jgi:DNA polymerase-3 subunit beta